MKTRTSIRHLIEEVRPLLKEQESLAEVLKELKDEVVETKEDLIVELTEKVRCSLLSLGLESKLHSGVALPFATNVIEEEIKKQKRNQLEEEFLEKALRKSIPDVGEAAQELNERRAKAVDLDFARGAVSAQIEGLYKGTHSNEITSKIITQGDVFLKNVISQKELEQNISKILESAIEMSKFSLATAFKFSERKSARDFLKGVGRVDRFKPSWLKHVKEERRLAEELRKESIEVDRLSSSLNALKAFLKKKRTPEEYMESVVSAVTRHALIDKHVMSQIGNEETKMLAARIEVCEKNKEELDSQWNNTNAQSQSLKRQLEKLKNARDKSIKIEVDVDEMRTAVEHLRNRRDSLLKEGREINQKIRTSLDLGSLKNEIDKALEQQESKVRRDNTNTSTSYSDSFSTTNMLLMWMLLTSSNGYAASSLLGTGNDAALQPFNNDLKKEEEKRESGGGGGGGEYLPLTSSPMVESNALDFKSIDASVSSAIESVNYTVESTPISSCSSSSPSSSCSSSSSSSCGGGGGD